MRVIVTELNKVGFHPKMYSAKHITMTAPVKTLWSCIPTQLSLVCKCPWISLLQDG